MVMALSLRAMPMGTARGAMATFAFGECQRRYYDSVTLSPDNFYIKSFDCSKRKGFDSQSAESRPSGFLSVRHITQSEKAVPTRKNSVPSAVREAREGKP